MYALVRHDLAVYAHSLRLQMQSAIRLRGAFLLQSLGVLLNDVALIVAWLFLFNQFGTINGWGAQQFIGVIGINMLVFGTMMLLSVGVMDLPRLVDRGGLDSLLTRPAPLLLQLAGGTIDPTTFADALLGLGITAWFVASVPLSALHILLFLVAIVISMVLFWCFGILLPSLLAFYVYDSERLSRYAGFLILDSSSYPTGVLTGRLRLVLLTVLPSLYIGAVPLGVLYRFDWQVAVAGIAVGAFWLTVSLLLFKRALRRYESSNLIGVRL